MIINYNKAGFRHDLQELLLENMTTKELLNQLVSAMSDDEARENFEYIARMNDIDIEEEGGL